MSARVCQVGAPVEPCGYEAEGRTPWCSAHRKRRTRHGDALAHVPVARQARKGPKPVRAAAQERAGFLVRAGVVP